jgi:short-subunit dehydrogenase
MFELKDKVIIVTGAPSGSGLAAVKAFASEGAKVVMAARRLDKLLEIEKQLSGVTETLVVKTDVSLEEDCKNLVEQTIKRFSRIDVLVNNAGISMRALFIDLDLSVIKRLMDVNFWGTVYCTKYALPYILKNHGSIIGVISIAGFKGLPARTGYSASKFAIYGFLETLRIEHLKDNLHVIREEALVSVGSRQGETPRDESSMMTAEDCVKHLIKGIKKRKSQVILTPIGKLTVLINKFFPRLVDRLEYNYMKKEPDSPLK